MKKRIFSGVVFASACTLLVLSSCDKEDDEMVTPTPTPVVSDLYVSSNTSGSITIYDVASTSSITSSSVTVPNADADGIYYDAAADRLIQYDRTNKKLNAYNNASMLSGSATPSFSIDVPAANGRELTVNGSTAVVASNSDSALFVFTIGSNSFTLTKSQKIGFESWGIQLVGNTLYAVVDKTSDLAVYENYSSMGAGDISATKRVTVAGIVRTHGLQYVASKDMMLMTDVADAASETDGALHIINGFSGKLAATANGGTIALADQIRIDGTASKLGNPVDVAYDMNNDRIYIAERKTSGGLLLGFDTPSANSQAAPAFNMASPGAAAVYMQN